MRIICEWNDKTGKTTLVKYLSENLGFKVIKCSQPKTEDAFSEYVELFWKHTWKEIVNDNVIFDRSWIGECVYGKIYRKKGLKKFQIKRLDVACQRHNDLIIRCTGNTWDIKKRFVADKEDFAQIKDVGRIQRYFLKTMKMLKTPVIQYDLTLSNMNSILYIIRELNAKGETIEHVN